MDTNGINEQISGEKPLTAMLSNVGCLVARLYFTEVKKVAICCQLLVDILMKMSDNKFALIYW